MLINFSSRPVTGRVELKNAAGFAPVKITGAEISPGHPLPDFHLNGYEWRIYHRPVAK